MLNSIEFYEEAGRSAARARNQKDEQLAECHARWFRQARDLESGTDRFTAYDAYRRGYEEVRIVPPVDYFR